MDISVGYPCNAPCTLGLAGEHSFDLLGVGDVDEGVLLPPPHAASGLLPTLVVLAHPEECKS